MKRITDETIPKADISGIVIYGSGRHFSSGADLADLIGPGNEDPSPGTSGINESETSFFNDNLQSFRFFEKLNIPVIAAIRGVCLGSALELALFCRARICGAGAVLGLPETTFGLIPGCGGIQKMITLTGMPRALELVLSGTSFSAEEALQWKIVDTVVPKNMIVESAIQMIHDINSR